MYCFWCVFHSAPDVVFLAITALNFWVPLHNRWYVVIDVQGNVLRFFAIDHVLVSVVTIVTTGAIFSLQFTKNRLAAGLRPDPLGELERSPRPPSRLLLRGGEGREGDKMRGEGKRGDRKGVKGELKGREGKGWEKGKGKGEGRGRGREMAPLTQILGSAPAVQVKWKGYKNWRFRPIYRFMTYFENDTRYHHSYNRR